MFKLKVKSKPCAQAHKNHKKTARIFKQNRWLTAHPNKIAHLAFHP
jgi:hypothetical protein